ncbi:hypothetical protein AEM51_08280 [Bacteroidetes bacterium UKL13-3]|nr:hypothetical protein AEM51_08280 [Bacteroidetes bacterium UKL13-3]HCP94279.1 hypothetical protein [Bacteroidota bacterium]
MTNFHTPNIHAEAQWRSVIVARRIVKHVCFFGLLFVNLNHSNNYLPVNFLKGTEAATKSSLRWICFAHIEWILITTKYSIMNLIFRNRSRYNSIQSLPMFTRTQVNTKSTKAMNYKP